MDLVAQLEQRVAELEENAGSGSSCRNSSKPALSGFTRTARSVREKAKESSQQRGYNPVKGYTLVVHVVYLSTKLKSELPSVTTPKDYQYKAFVSYCHRKHDRKWAKWLVNKLEIYRIPSSLQKKGYSEKIGTIFRDDDEISAAADLSVELIKALEDSEFLIVICSPNTPHSEWVSKEIETFHKLGKSNQILSLLIKGEPHESFPSIMQSYSHSYEDNSGRIKTITNSLEPLAADVRPREDENFADTEQRALLKLASSLLGCDFDELARRDKERVQKKRRLIWISLILLSFAVLEISRNTWSWFFAPQTKYYRTYTEKFLIPHGVGEIEEDELNRHTTYYEIVTKRDVVKSLAYRVTVDYPIVSGERERKRYFTPWLTPVAQWTLEYDSEGNLINTNINDSNASNLFRIKSDMSSGQSTAIIEYEQGKRGTIDRQAYFLHQWLPDFVFDNNKNHNFKHQHAIYLNRLTFSINGFVKYRQFINSNNEPIRVDGEISGYEYEYLDDGRIARVFFINDKNERTMSSYGIFGSELAELDPDVATDKKTYTIKSKYEGFSTSFGYSYFDTNLDMLLLDKDGNLINSKDGFSMIDVENSLSKGEKYTLYDNKGQNVESQSGYSTVIIERDNQYKLLAINYFDISGKLIKSETNYK